MNLKEKKQVQSVPLDKHYGQIVERAIRRNGFSISELARLANVNRRSVYNWFNQRYLKPEIIFRVGCALKYDFSQDFPELFTEEEFKRAFQQANVTSALLNTESPEPDNLNYWKNKYIAILEEYNELLLKQVKNDTVAPHTLMKRP